MVLLPSAMVNAASVNVHNGHNHKAAATTSTSPTSPSEKPERDEPPNQKRRDAGMGGCFSAWTEVETKRGRLRMDEVQVGDEILTSQLANGANRVFLPVKHFLHRNPDVVEEFVILTTTHNRTLTLTPNHLLPLVDCKTALGENLQSLNWRFASRATPGICVVGVDGRLVEIAQVGRTKARGIYAPLVTNGYFYADDVLVSCYASFENQLMQYSLFKLLFTIWDVSDWFRSSSPAMDVPQLVDYGHMIANVVFEKITV